MSPAIVLTVFAASPFAGSTSPALTAVLHTPGLMVSKPKRSRDELRADYKRVAKMANPQSRPNPFELTPELLVVYWEISDPRNLPAGERTRKLRALKSKLETMRDRLKLIRLREQKRVRRLNARSNRTRRSSRRPQPNATASGGNGIAVRAAGLINLIQNTINPESWAVNGGLGTISFYGNPLYVLVVRASSEVHHQIGGALPAIRR